MDSILLSHGSSQEETTFCLYRIMADERKIRGPEQLLRTPGTRGTICDTDRILFPHTTMRSSEIETIVLPLIEKLCKKGIDYAVGLLLMMVCIHW